MAGADSSKKLIPMKILEILRKRTDETHTMDQKEILDELNKSYDPPLDRKTVRRNIGFLIEMGFPVYYEVKPRKNGNDIWTDFYLDREFSEPELRLLIDGLLFSNHVPYKRCMALIEKLEGLASENFKAHVKHIKTLPDTEVYNQQIFLTIEVLDEAISANRQVSFNYVNYGTDKKLHPKPGKDGKPAEYIINPYQMAAKNGKYYLICNNDIYGNISNYRIDRITNIRMLDTPRKPFSKLRNSDGKNLNLGDYIKNHIYMYCGGDTRVRFKVVPEMVTDVIDVFGKDVTFEGEQDGYVVVSTMVTEGAMKVYAQTHAPDVIILEPQRLVDEMKKWAKDVKKAYN